QEPADAGLRTEEAKDPDIEANQAHACPACDDSQYGLNHGFRSEFTRVSAAGRDGASAHGRRALRHADVDRDPGGCPTGSAAQAAVAPYDFTDHGTVSARIPRNRHSRFPRTSRTSVRQSSPLSDGRLDERDG